MSKKFNLDEFKTSLSSMSLEELRELEEKVITECDEIDKEATETNFNMPTENYEEVSKAIKYFLDKQTVQWQYTLSMIAMYDFWKDECPKTIPYAQLDSVLRTIGGMQFTGYNEWAMVVAINKYFEPLREEYSKVMQKVYDAASKHQLVMEAIGLAEPFNVQDEE